MPRIVGPPKWSGARDREGHREWRITYRVEALLIGVDSRREGPAAVMQTFGLPVPGDRWLVDGDVDLWAFCKLNMEVEPQVEDDGPIRWFLCHFTFSTKPDELRCKTQQIDDPLLVPQRVSGGFSKYQEEALFDRFNNPIVNSAWEQLRGQQVEFDKHRSTLCIEQNVPILQYQLCKSMLDCVNQFPMWDLPERCWKMSKFDFSKKYYGQCFPYYERKFEFEANTKTNQNPILSALNPVVSGWDRDLLDEGHKVLSGHWDGHANWALDPVANDGSSPDPDPWNPAHFIPSVDPAGNAITVVLDGTGKPITGNTGAYDLTGTVIDASFDPDMQLPTIIACSAPHGLTTGDLVYISGAVNASNVPLSINGTWKIQLGSASGTFDPVTKFYLPACRNNHVLNNTPAWKRVVRKTFPGTISVQKYNEADFTLLSVPLII